MADAVLAVHTDEANEVWSGRLGQSPRRTRLTPRQFVTEAEVQGVIRVVATKGNIELLCRFYERYNADTQVRLEVATPRLVPQLAQPPEVLETITQSRRFAASLGGWHEFTALDHPSYLLALCLNPVVHGEPKQDWRVVLESHPAWRVANFIPTLRPLAFAQWLAEIRDPRWFIQPKDPDGTAPLERFLGLWPQNQERVLLKTREALATPAGHRCWLTRSCWMSPHHDELDGVDHSDPRNFLYRTFGALAEKDSVKALVRASQLFTRFVRAAWLDGLQGNSAHAGQLFDPEQFLKGSAELAAFAAYSETRS